MVSERDGHLAVVHVSEVPGLRGSTYANRINELEIRAELGRQVQGLRAEGVDAELYLAPSTGDSASTIVDVAQRVRADMIVVGTHGRSALANLVLGSVTQRLLRAAYCPVLAVPSRAGPIQDLGR